MGVQRYALRSGAVRYRARVKSHGQEVATRVFERKADALAWEQDQRRRLHSGEWIDPRRGQVPLSSVAADWLSSRSAVKRRTRESDESAWRNYVRPRFGNWPVASITGAEVSAWVGGLVARGLAPSTATGSVAGPLPFGRVVAVEVANAFSGLAGGTAAVFATRVRFFQQQGYDATVALSSGAIMTTSSWIAITVLFLVSLPFSWGSIHIEVTPESGGDSKLVWIILAVVVLVALAAGLVLAVPRFRRLAAEKARPKVRDIWGNLTQVARSPRKLVLLVGGSFAKELLVAMALSVSLRAFDDHLRLPTLIVVIFLAGILGGIAPSPGGMGVVEAGLILGLTAAGVSEADATAAVFIQRLFTSYLPPLWGWATLVWMRKREYL
jgi:uncharacterized membrane protein YbhN (UPF0104 family)